LLIAHSGNCSGQPGTLLTSKSATCGARVKTFEPSTPVEVSTSAGSSAFSVFGLATSVLPGSGVPR
jgi:hypothetical protein